MVSGAGGSGSGGAGGAGHASGRGQALLLRAEVTHRGVRLVAPTLHVSPTEVTIACTGIAQGETVQLALSFPGILEPLELGARVVSTSPGRGHGDPASITCEITHASRAAREGLEGLVARDAEEPAGVYRCLLADDNSFIRDLFAYAMGRYRGERRRDIQLTAVQDAEAAWKALGEGDFSLAIIDHFLPRESGAHLIGRMRADPRLARMPIVAISVGGDEAREASLAAGADLFLDKPIVMKTLFETIDRLGVGRKAAAEKAP